MARLCCRWGHFWIVCRRPAAAGCDWAQRIRADGRAGNKERERAKPKVSKTSGAAGAQSQAARAEFNRVCKGHFSGPGDMNQLLFCGSPFMRRLAGGSTMMMMMMNQSLSRPRRLLCGRQARDRPRGAPTASASTWPDSGSLAKLCANQNEISSACPLVGPIIWRRFAFVPLLKSIQIARGPRLQRAARVVCICPSGWAQQRARRRYLSTGNLAPARG